MTYAKRTDLNQQEIINALRKAGATVVDASKMHKGFPDLIVGYKGHTLLLECKSNPKAKFTPDQLKFIANWTGGTLARVDNIESALRVLATIDQ